MDTVYPADHPFQEQQWLEDGVLNGPGLADMKGGLCVILHALDAFERDAGCDPGGLRCDDQLGRGNRFPVFRSADFPIGRAGKYAALTYEPSALPDGTLAHARGGSGNYSVIAKGRSAHAGRNPQDGRNAVLALADLALRLKALEHAELSVNPAKIEGGAANNVVPDHAILRFNIRPKTIPAAEGFEVEMVSLLKAVSGAHDVALERHGGVTRQPKPVGEKAQKLFDSRQGLRRGARSRHRLESDRRSLRWQQYRRAARTCSGYDGRTWRCHPLARRISPYRFAGRTRGFICVAVVPAGVRRAFVGTPMSFRIRAARPADIEPLYQMAKLTGGGFTNFAS